MTNYEELRKRDANFAPLTPVDFLFRAASVHPDRLAVVYGETRRNWRQVAERCRRLASALVGAGLGRGDVVAIMAHNTPEMMEAHFGVPMAGLVLNTINTRLDCSTVAYIIEHSEAKAIIVDREFLDLVRRALEVAGRNLLVIEILDPAGAGYTPSGARSYDHFLSSGDCNFSWSRPEDEWGAIALSYTSGTTGRPKGVVYHHRGAYLNALGNILSWDMPRHPVYLWTLPMFHCNGWCFPWTIAALAGVNVCLRRFDGATILEAIDRHSVSHICGAPIVMSMVVNATKVSTPRLGDRRVAFMTAGAAPPAAVIEAMDTASFDVTHVYGLTEVYGPCVVCESQEDWPDLPTPELARRQARQGVRYVTQSDATVLDGAGAEVLPNGQTIGEIVIRGNAVMKGYLKAPEETEKAFADGWFHTGDLGVRHPDGYIEIKDRAKDIIISGGENISSLEVESVLHTHPAVLDAAVVARADTTWGEVPCAFVMLRPGFEVTPYELIAYCRERLAHFKAPKSIFLADIPKSATGKVDKGKLRELSSQIGSPPLEG
jgi:fatty-acyl-CoA synthase